METGRPGSSAATPPPVQLESAQVAADAQEAWCMAAVRQQAIPHSARTAARSGAANARAKSPSSSTEMSLIVRRIA